LRVAAHFLALGRITWDFRRGPGGGWGGNFLAMPGVANVTRLVNLFFSKFNHALEARRPRFTAVLFRQWLTEWNRRGDDYDIDLFCADELARGSPCSRRRPAHLFLLSLFSCSISFFCSDLCV
jgi:hypothetical protein